MIDESEKNEAVIMEIKTRFEEAKLSVFEDVNTLVTIDYEVACGCGIKLTLTIVSKKFEGMKHLSKHRLVQGVIQDMLEDGRVHAVTMDLKTS